MADDVPGAVPTPRLRRATDADVDGIRRLVDAAYEGYRPLLGRTPMPMLTDFAVAVREHEVWVLAVDERLVAVIELITRDDHLWIDNVAVHPSEQGRGHGRRLLAFAEVEARRLGTPEIGLLTNEHYHANIAMYERYGYRETRREPYRGSDLVHFRKTLQA